jgi:hypothetical protein
MRVVIGVGGFKNVLQEMRLFMARVASFYAAYSLERVAKHLKRLSYFFCRNRIANSSIPDLFEQKCRQNTRGCWCFDIAKRKFSSPRITKRSTKFIVYRTVARCSYRR